jgi:hypothetical protein
LCRALAIVNQGDFSEVGVLMEQSVFWVIQVNLHSTLSLGNEVHGFSLLELSDDYLFRVAQAGLEVFDDQFNQESLYLRQFRLQALCREARCGGFYLLLCQVSYEVEQYFVFAHCLAVNAD